MRQRNTDLHSRVNGKLSLRYTGKGLTSYAGLELFRVFLQQFKFSEMVRRHFRGLGMGGDYSAVAMIRLIVSMLIAGASRLRHVDYLESDPVVERLCGLCQLPTERTLSRWLSRCSAPVRAALIAINAELVSNAVRPLNLRRYTIDVDGSVISTGLQAERAFRGYNPHNRKSPSYYPITAHLAQTGHILRVQNRSGNIHDGKTAPPFLRDLFKQVREMDSKAILEIRLDGAFFRREIVTWLESRAEYSIKVPFYKWMGLKKLIQERKRWRRVRPGLDGFFTDLWLPTWKRSVRVAIYRTRVKHKSPKNYQLDLFDPNDGHWEYSAVTTNKGLGLKALWDFMAGRSCHEKVYAELKGGYAFDTVPTKNYAANSAWQIISAMAHNLMINFQIAAGAAKRRHTPKRSPIFALKSVRTIRFEMIARAGIIQRPNGKATLTLSRNLPTRKLFQKAEQHLAKAA